jgi:hypothetical protein
VNASSSLMRHLAVSALVALAIGITPMRLGAQSSGSGVFMPANAIGQLSIAGAAPVPIYAIGFDVQASGLTGGGGAGAPKFELSIEKQPDVLSTLLFRSTVQGVHLAGVRIDLYRPGGTAIGSTIDISDVLVTAFTTTDRQGEAVGFNFSQIAFTAGGQTFCWNTQANASC